MLHWCILFRRSYPLYPTEKRGENPLKKLLIALLALALCFCVATAEETVIDFENGSTGVFQQSGSCSVAVTDAIAHEGGKALAVTGRSGNNWDAVDLNAKALGIDVGVPAKITAWVYVDSDEAGTFVISKAGGDYATLGSVNCAGRTWTEITADIDLDQPVNIRFQNLSENWNNAEYYIDDMVVEVGQAEEIEESTEPPIDYTSDFSAGEDGWYARSAGGASVSVTDEQGLLIVGRTATWNSPGRDFELTTGKTYALSVLVKQDQVASTGFILSVAHTRDGSESYENLATCTAKKGEWTLMQATYVAGRYDTYVFYIEGGAEDTSYQIKAFPCHEQTLKYGKAGIPSLKEVYAPYFDFGTAVTGNEVLDADRMEFYKSQFDIFTPGNEMKPDALINIAGCKSAVRKTGDETQGVVRFDRCIPLLDWAQENGVKVHGHTLVWHSQTPKQFFHEGYNTTSPLVSREVMLGRMENYIKQVLTWTEENYPGVIVSWDVVNEAVGDGADQYKVNDLRHVRTMRNGQPNPFYEYVGEDYEADMAKMELCPITQEWWKHTKPCFVKYAIDPGSEFYHDMKSIFYYE